MLPNPVTRRSSSGHGLPQSAVPAAGAWWSSTRHAARWSSLLQQLTLAMLVCLLACQSGCRHVNDAAVHAIYKYCNTIVTLDLTLCQGVTLSSIHQLVSG